MRTHRVPITRDENIPLALPDLGGNERSYVMECLTSGWVSSQGKFVEEFERRMAAFTGTAHAVATSNGTAALHLALAGLGVGKGDEVIVPALTFIATVNAVTYTGATPVFVDVEESTWGMDPAQVSEAITERTRAIIPVHLYGQPCRIDALLEIASRHRVAVIEDVAEAQGAEYQGTRVGAFGTAGCFSFFANKIMTTGEGGMVVTNDRSYYERMIMLRGHGMSPERRYWHPIVGFNYRLTNIQAAMGCAQLERIDAFLRGRDAIKACYNRLLATDVRIIVPPELDVSRSVCWLYTVLINEQRVAASRDSVLDALRRSHIDCRPMFYPLHVMPPYERNRSFPVAERLARTGVTLPTHVGLSEDSIRRICHVLQRSL